MKKILLIIFISLFLLNSCAKARHVTYEVISTKKNTVIKYREMKDNNYGTKLTETKLLNSTNWNKHVVLHTASFYSEDKLEFELIVTGEGEGKIFAGLKNSDIVGGTNYESVSVVYACSNETTDNYVRLVMSAKELYRILYDVY